MLAKKSPKSKPKKAKKKIRLSSIKTEKGTLEFVRSRAFERYLKGFIFTQVYVSKRDLLKVRAETARFKSFFLKHPNEQIRTIATKKYERVLSELGVKK